MQTERREERRKKEANEAMVKKTKEKTLLRIYSFIYYSVDF
jgi:hypothetical protein